MPRQKCGRPAPLACPRDTEPYLIRGLQRYLIKSAMDVGACWGLNAGYSFHALENDVEKAFVLDGRITNLSRQRAEGYGRQANLVEVVLGNFLKITRPPKVDAVTINKAEFLGFRLEHFENYVVLWRDMPFFHDHAYIFRRHNEKPVYL